MNYIEIVKAHNIDKVTVNGAKVIVNGVSTFIYSNKKIAEAVAFKLNMFIGVTR